MYKLKKLNFLILLFIWKKKKQQPNPAAVCAISVDFSVKSFGDPQAMTFAYKD